ncbi:hypothetical protein [Streptomyces himastatinicus]|uniref:hypothetical protein n=1 Tax=Streptomyces himastatinicus TaxID=998084 RepID=UPI0001B50263
MASFLTPGRRLFAKAALAAAAVPVSAAASALRLPAPQGPYAVGALTLHLVDPSRNDPWEPRIGVRELMVTVLRPVAAGRGSRCSRRSVR